MSFSKRFLILAVALLTLLPVFSSCKANDAKPSGTTPSADTTSPGDGETAEPEDNFYADRQNAKDGLPEKMDFGGAEIRIIGETGTKDRIANCTWFAESSSDVIEEAIYRRNEIISSRLNIKMVNMSDGTATEDVDDKVKLSVTTFSDDYDVAPYNTSLMLEGCYRDIMDLDYVNWDAPWWNQTYRDAATIEERLFSMTGEIKLTVLASTFLTYFNKTLMQDLHSDIDIYQLVRDGNWTIDKMTELCDSVYNDENGDGLLDENDRFANAMAYDVGQANTLAGGADLEYVRLDVDNGWYVWSLENNKTASFLQKCKRLLFENNRTWTYPNNYKDNDYLYIGKLLEGTALFTFSTMSTTEFMRDMPDPGFGILPPPKYDEAQEVYTSYSDTLSALTVPVTTTIEDVVGAFLEAAASQNYRTVTPAYFDTAVKSKYARDEESAEMLDIIVAGTTISMLSVLQGYLDWNAITVIPKLLCTENGINRGMSLISKHAKNANSLLMELPDRISSIG